MSQNNQLEQVEQVLDAMVRPALRGHGGEVEILELVEGMLRVRLLGQCSGCPSAAITTEGLIAKELCEAIPEIKGVTLINGVSEDLLESARSILRARR